MDTTIVVPNNANLSTQRLQNTQSSRDKLILKTMLLYSTHQVVRAYVTEDSEERFSRLAIGLIGYGITAAIAVQMKLARNEREEMVQLGTAHHDLMRRDKQLQEARNSAFAMYAAINSIPECSSIPSSIPIVLGVLFISSFILHTTT